MRWPAAMLYVQMTEAVFVHMFRSTDDSQVIVVGMPFFLALPFPTLVLILSPSFRLFWPGSFQDQLITINRVYGSPQLAEDLPALGWPTRSFLCYGTSCACQFPKSIAVWAWFLKP
ncbi:hypothetical protein ASPBRDRAFT_311672 [Aspergillus brasiliensis CBS 101740]|uniref:Uncharacterized protein n=1 Tax=Aspergillus brasiliensis (strain CBS 101740 / IMI 381727 / IBT 21946) TaxID=767769 RepID=A0A1L9UAK7_ASPBC|nr:hypothetical protein ASPBRDRAFT_311672 [Aspergillus brasiliensis CBS 101740]